MMPDPDRFDPAAPTLFLAAEGPEVWVGYSETGHWLRRIKKTGGAVEDLFPAVQEALGGQPVESVAQFLYTAGPGSLLGLRTASAAIRTWNVLFPAKGYFRMSGMVWTARRLQSLPELPPDFCLVAPARSGFWNILPATAGARPVLTDIRLEPEAVLLALPPPLFLLPHRTLKKLPRPDLTPVAEDYADLPANWGKDGIVEPGDGQLFVHETNDFTKWTPTRHR